MHSYATSRSAASRRWVWGFSSLVDRMKCSGTMANLFRTRLWVGWWLMVTGVMRRAGEGLAKGLKGGFLSAEGEGDGLGLLAREGEKRSWNWGSWLAYGVENG